MGDFKEVRVGTAMFVFKDGKFLVGLRKGKHGQDTWSVPGGHLKFGETVEEGIIREVKEETGMEVANIRFGAITDDMFPESGRQYLSIWMIADWKAGEPIVQEPDKFIAFEWRDFDSLPSPLFEPCWKNLLSSPYINQIKEQL